MTYVGGSQPLSPAPVPLIESSANTPRRRFRPKVLPTLATIVSIAVFVAAGEWQRGRMGEKQRQSDQFDWAYQATPVPLPAESDDWSLWRYRAIVAEGVFDGARQILLDNKVDRGRIGFHVITPLRLNDGRAVLVDRGFVASTGSRTVLPSVPPPDGIVTVYGRVNIPPARYLELARTPQVGAVWQNLDPARYSMATGITVLPIVVEQAVDRGSGDPLTRNAIRPDFGIARHRVYMVQWYVFAVMAAGLWLYFNRPWRHSWSL